MKPLTYVNLSGDAAASFVTFYKFDPKTDDIDMDFEKVRFRRAWAWHFDNVAFVGMIFRNPIIRIFVQRNGTESVSFRFPRRGFGRHSREHRF